MTKTNKPKKTQQGQDMRGHGEDNLTTGLQANNQMNLPAASSLWATSHSILSPSTIIWHQKSGPNGILCGIL